MKKTKLGIKFWLYLVFSIIAGAVVSFALTRFALRDHIFWQVIIGASLGLLCGLGILFRFPAPNTNETGIGRYAFWPSLALGTALSLGALSTQIPILPFTLSNIVGFALILALFLRYEFGEKKEEGNG